MLSLSDLSRGSDFYDFNPLVLSSCLACLAKSKLFGVYFYNTIQIK